jgi:ArsR family transcriptional regulator
MSFTDIQVVKVAKALSDVNRLQILEMLKTGEKCACALLDEMKITQPTLSHHMKILCDAGLVTGRKEGRWVHYSIDKKAAEEALRAISDRIEVRSDIGAGQDCSCCSDKAV